MSKILKVDKPSDYSSWVGHAASNELISVIDYSAVSPVRHSLNHMGSTAFFCKGMKKTRILSMVRESTIIKQEP